jgi:hypothetical protein
MRAVVFLLASLFLAGSPYAQTANSTPMTVCNGNYCQEVAGALLRKLLQNGWELKQAAREVISPGICGPSATGAKNSAIRFFVPEYACFGKRGSFWESFLCGADLTRKTVYFGAACEGHDSCYGGANSNKAECDANLRRDMIAACDETLPSNWPRARETCRLQAETYEYVLGKGGCGAFISAQSAAGNDNASCEQFE